MSESLRSSTRFERIKASVDADKPLVVPPDPTRYGERLSTAILNARDNFSAETATPFRLPERVSDTLKKTGQEILQALLSPPTFRMGRKRGSHHYHHIRTSPETVLKDDYGMAAEYDTIIPRKHFHFDIYRAMHKLNAAEDCIHKDGYIIETSLPEANLIVLFTYLREPANSYDTHVDTAEIVAGPHPDNPNETIWIDNGNPFYQRFGQPPALPPWPTPLTPIDTSPTPTNIRLITEDYVIQAFKMLTQNFTMFMVKREGGDKQRVAIVRFEDQLSFEGELEFATSVWYGPDAPIDRPARPNARSGTKTRSDTSEVKADSLSPEAEWVAGSKKKGSEKDTDWVPRPSKDGGRARKKQKRT